MNRLAGLVDILEGLGYWRLWLRMGWMDIVRRYRRTTLGPFWNTMTVGAFIGATGFMYAGIFGQELNSYLPYLSSGFTVWVPVASFITETTGAFLAGEPTLRQMRVPLSIYVYQGIVRNMIVFGHNLTVYLIVIILFPIKLTPAMWLVLPAMLILCLNAVWVGVILSLLCTRYRDLQQAVGSLLQVAFFLTPIFWQPGQAGRAQQVLVVMNPFYHFVDILRSPMMGNAPAHFSWMFAIATTVVGWTMMIVLFNRYRDRVVFWF